MIVKMDLRQPCWRIDAWLPPRRGENRGRGKGSGIMKPSKMLRDSRLNPFPLRDLLFLCVPGGSRMPTPPSDPPNGRGAIKNTSDRVISPLRLLIFKNVAGGSGAPPGLTPQQFVFRLADENTSNRSSQSSLIVAAASACSAMTSRQIKSRATRCRPLLGRGHARRTTEWRLPDQPMECGCFRSDRRRTRQFSRRPSTAEARRITPGTPAGHSRIAGFLRQTRTEPLMLTGFGGSDSA